MKNKFACSDIDKNLTSFEKAKVVIVPCPYEGTVTYQKGTSKGPSKIIEASLYMETFDDELETETFKIGIHTKEPLSLKHLPPKKMVESVRKEVLKILKSGKLPVCIGGEHSISVGCVEAAKYLNNNVSVLHLDAHYDLRDSYEGSKYNHACVARRFLEHCSVVELGVRSLSREGREFLNTNPPNLVSITRERMRCHNNWINSALASLTDNVYLTIDLDVFDPGCMPSVGTPEPGGIEWQEALDLLKELAKRKKIVGFDVVELAPIKGLTAPNYMAAKLIYRILGYISIFTNMGG